MGRKGVSKRKPQKSKNPKMTSTGEKGSVPGATRVSESPAGQLIGKGEAISVVKGGRKK